MDIGREIGAAFYGAMIEDRLEEIAAMWRRCHKLAVGLPDPWAALDAELLTCLGLARRLFEAS